MPSDKTAREKKEKDQMNDVGSREINSRTGEYVPSAPIELPEGSQFGDYTVCKKIASDTGLNCIYIVKNKKKEEFALKLEHTSEKEPMLRTELFILLQMAKAGGEGKHFCKVFDKGQMKDFNYIIITLTGKSLRILRKESKNQRFSIGCALSVGMQCLQGLEILHEKGFIHRDVQPSNFAVGRAEARERRLIYCLDFGFAHQYKTKDGQVKPKRPAKSWAYRGNLRYASRNCYTGEELSRMDDLEMWLYMVVEFAKGCLPWMNQRDLKEVYEWQVVARTDFGIRQLFGGLPCEFVEVMNYIDSLHYEDEPDYNKIYGLIQNALCINCLDEYPYDWEGDQQPLSGAVQAHNSNDKAAPKSEKKGPNSEKKTLKSEKKAPRCEKKDPKSEKKASKDEKKSKKELKDKSKKSEKKSKKESKDKSKKSEKSKKGPKNKSKQDETSKKESKEKSKKGSKEKSMTGDTSKKESKEKSTKESKEKLKKDTKEKSKKGETSKKEPKEKPKKDEASKKGSKKEKSKKGGTSKKEPKEKPKKDEASKKGSKKEKSKKGETSKKASDKKK